MGHKTSGARFSIVQGVGPEFGPRAMPHQGNLPSALGVNVSKCLGLYAGVLVVEEEFLMLSSSQGRLVQDCGLRSSEILQLDYIRCTVCREREGFIIIYRNEKICIRKDALCSYMCKETKKCWILHFQYKEQGIAGFGSMNPMKWNGPAV